MSSRCLDVIAVHPTLREIMASSSEIGRGAKRRTTGLSRGRVNEQEVTNERTLTNDHNDPALPSTNTEDARDSGLSSESSTPTNGSPPPRQPRITGTSATLANSSITLRGKQLDATRIANARTSRLLRNRSGNDSPRSLDSVRSRQVSSPFRPVFTGNVQSPSLDSSDDGSLRVERFTYHQDIVSIKTGLLKLMRVVQESGENGLTRAETLNPFNTTMVNGLFNNLNEDGITDTCANSNNGTVNVADELTDLRRQIVFLQGQLEDKDRTIQQLQMQVSKHQDLSGVNSQSSSSSMNGSCSFNKDTCNATTQTEKIRPVSAGPSLLQSLPQDSGMGPLVSWSDSWNRQRPPSLADISMTRNLRKPSDRSPRTSRPRPDDQTPIRHNGFTEKSLITESPMMKRLVKPRDTIPNKSLDLNDYVRTSSSKAELTPTKTSIPSLKKLTPPTQIPRAARAVSATGRPHNL